jgi:outer membrane biosynthesis protein TonB
MSVDLARRDAQACRARTRRAVVASLVIHALIMLWLVFFAGKSDGPPTITEVTWLDPKDLEPPKPPPPPAPAPVAKPVPPAPKPAPVVASAPKAAPKPPTPKLEPVRPAGKANIADKAGESGVARAPAASGGGEKGRAAGARVAQEVAQTAASIDNALSSLSGSVPVAGGTSGGGGGKKVSDRFAVAGGRGDGALPTSEGDLRGSGVGAVGAGSGAGGGRGSGRGVQKTAVAIVDEGVDTAGDGAGSAGRDSRSLMAVVQRYVAGVKFCYDNALKKNPQLAGKITLQMDITAPGAVTQLEPVDDSMGNAALERCILSQVEGWKFPAIPSGTVRFTLPLVFTPPQGVSP